MATKTFDVMGDVRKHVQSRVRGNSFKSNVIDKTDQVVQHKIRSNSEASRQITGQSMPPLSDTYSRLKSDLTGSARADLRYGFDDEGNPKDHALDMLYSQVDQQGDDYNIGYGFRSSADKPGKTAEQYMLENQYGTGKPVRKWFPEEEVANTQGVRALTNEVRRLIETHLDKGTITKNITLGQKRNS